MSDPIVIVGGGVIGTTCAYYLTKAGESVVLIDQGDIGQACSRGNCGYVCPSHVLPLAAPGAIGSTLKTMLQKNSPLAVRLRFDPSLWGWMLRFALKCNQRDMIDSGHAISAILNHSRTLYGELFEREPIDAEWEQRGLLFVFQTEKAMNHYAETDHLLAEVFGQGAVRYDGAKLTELEPSLKPGIAGGWHYPGDAHLRPDLLMSGLRQIVLQQGGDIREKCQFRQLERDGRRIVAVQTDQGRIPTSRVVMATGAWTPLFAKELGCKVPIQPGKGYSLTMPRPRVCPTIPLIFEEHRVAITPMRDSYRIGSTMEFAGYDATMNPKRLALLRDGAAIYLQEPTAEPVMEQWWGWRPMIYDGKPIIGPSPAWDNLWIAAGHGMLGLSMATGTGQLISELVTGKAPSIDPAPYAVTRF
ncbi:NAD(P)/FAD-dependent oxidoreductase [Tuwongella immobilis]|uniref:FAD dependent oxidoreductase domain-containing protein n=1 Tax=Tuwongella immobilis TaxID=692036 RepID=A0A6C2YHP7_9BACT|nr:FAD-dependent oxidoreductase [Tuwongella immobilis]VIP00575.1 amino acid dehydrogenase : FAD dependent oxidoreductase OS=Pirellula staleyi (strain ATCC 27377 / DSM 6068 / ICPB 4128) GN=Psta_1256 PE=4 SV=1: DAO [Tuwongella immobilis]VTR96568.1 amino acid dehydrogenase : FAD dependent oxidoreductase OS=Pirellula staleyi (strain ATCC 27377 / DSM 6068 / ICPB 4128) GN=Psta_1256 PE=4 SV=1: DAO [Tuwongella immobilis]